MDRYVSRNTQWVAVVVLLYTGVTCQADSPAVSAEGAGPEVSEATVESSAETKEKPLFQHASYPAAWTAAQESNRPILVYVSMPQCPHCSLMVENSYGTQEVKEILSDSFETLQVGRYTHPALVSKLHVRWYPTTVIVGSNNKVLDVIEGYVDSNTLKRRLQLGIASARSDATALK